VPSEEAKLLMRVRLVASAMAIDDQDEYAKLVRGMNPPM
jgi:hypothetical protein